MKKLIAILSVVLFANQASAEYFVLGFSEIKCTDYVDSKNYDNKRLSFLAWVMGYMTGRNFQTQSSTGSDKLAQIEVEIENICKDHPEYTLNEAAHSLYTLLCIQSVDFVTEVKCNDP